MHLYYNMLSLAWKGINLEREMGSTRFAFLFVYSLLFSHFLAVFLSYIMFILDIETSSYNTCAVGISASLFCLKYIWNQSSSSLTNIYGLSIPLKYAAWVECIIISIITPNASFVGHLSGILAGVVYLKLQQHSHLFQFMTKYLFTNQYTYTSSFLGSKRNSNNSNNSSNSTSTESTYNHNSNNENCYSQQTNNNSNRQNSAGNLKIYDS
jgi:hypothetical protein